MKEDFISVVSFYDWMSNRDDSCPLNVPDFSTGQWCDGRPLKKKKESSLILQGALDTNLSLQALRSTASADSEH